MLSLTLPTRGPFVSNNSWRWTSGGHGPCFSLKVRNTCSWHVVSSYLLNSRAYPPPRPQLNRSGLLSPLLFVRQGGRQYSAGPGGPPVWVSVTPAVSLEEVRQRPPWSQVGRGHSGDQTAPEAQRVCRSMNCWPPLREKSYSADGNLLRTLARWPGSRCLRPFRKFRLSSKLMRLQPGGAQGGPGWAGGAAGHR